MLSIKQLWESGVQFGHQIGRLNHKMKRFILKKHHGLHVIDLAKTMQQIRDAQEVAKEMVANHQRILFVGTKKQAKIVIRELAEECGEFYVSERWLGGTLTNLFTIRRSINKLDRIEKRISAGGEGLTKKELSHLTKEQLKLERNLSGVRGMRKLPGLLIVVDVNKEHIAIAEANKLGIPIMALVDTNCNPDPIRYVIASNDDAQKSIKVILQVLVQTIIDKKNEMTVFASKEDEEPNSNKEGEDLKFDSLKELNP